MAAMTLMYKMLDAMMSAVPLTDVTMLKMGLMIEMR